MDRPVHVRRGNPRVYVGHLDELADESDLFALFETVCQVHSAKIVRDTLGRSRYVGFVELSHEGDLPRALALHGSIFYGRRIVVERAREPDEK